MMRTTLDIDNDILAAAKEVARHERRSAGAVISELARKGLSMQAAPKRQSLKARNGVPILPRRKEVITVENIRRLMEEEDI